MNNEPKKECIMKYHLGLGELFDRLTILQIKEVKRLEDKKATTDEIEAIMHDINILVNNSTKQITAEVLRDLIILSQFNLHIWDGEDAARKGGTGDDLRITHSINGIRREAINRLQRWFGGRIDKKIDCLANVMASEFKEQWTPSGY